MTWRQRAPDWPWLFRRTWRQPLCYGALFAWAVVILQFAVQGDWTFALRSVLILIAALVFVQFFGVGLWRRERERRAVTMGSALGCAVILVVLGSASWWLGGLALGLFFLAFFGGFSSAQRSHRDEDERENRQRVERRAGERTEHNRGAP